MFPECPSTLSTYDELLLRLEQMQALLKTEPEEEDDEIVDIVTVTPPCQKLKVKEEEQETDVEPKFFLGPCISSQFVSETAQQVWSGTRSLRSSPVVFTVWETSQCLIVSFRSGYCFNHWKWRRVCSLQ